MHSSGSNSKTRRFTTRDVGKTRTCLVSVGQAQLLPHSETVRTRAKMAFIARAGQSPVGWELSVEQTGRSFSTGGPTRGKLYPLQFLGTSSDLSAKNLTSNAHLFMFFFYSASICCTWHYIKYFEALTTLSIFSPYSSSSSPLPFYFTSLDNSILLQTIFISVSACVPETEYNTYACV